MVRTRAEMSARARLALVVALTSLASLAVMVGLVPTMSVQSVVAALAALAAATALAGRRPSVHVHSAPGALQPRPRATDVPLVLAGRATDVVHHPVRPRAPGLV